MAGGGNKQHVEAQKQQDVGPKFGDYAKAALNKITFGTVYGGAKVGRLEYLKGLRAKAKIESKLVGENLKSNMTGPGARIQQTGQRRGNMVFNVVNNNTSTHKELPIQKPDSFVISQPIGNPRVGLTRGLAFKSRPVYLPPQAVVSVV